MKVKCAMLGGGVFEAVLVEAPSQMSRDDVQIVLEVSAGAPIQFQPPRPPGLELVEATPAERAGLKQAGFEL